MMSLCYAALNPRLSMADIEALAKIRAERNKEMFATLTKGMESLPTNEMRIQYLTDVLPLVTRMMFL